MGNRRIKLVEGEFYHLYNRGNSKQKIFLDEDDYDYFLKCLYCCNTFKNFNFREDVIKPGIHAFDYERGETLVSIGAWTLMPNHFHIYLTPCPKSGLEQKNKKHLTRNNVSEFMRKVSTAYAKYYNNKYERTGGLFEGKFKSVHIEHDNQAKYLFSYIHLNCIKIIQKDWKEVGITNIKNALEFLKNYRYSSYLDYKDSNRAESKILDKLAFPKYFSNTKDFDKEILSWLQYKEL